MREWAGPIGFLGGLLSLLFWLVVPLTDTAGTYFHTGQEPLYVVLGVLALLGIVGALMARSGSPAAPILMGIGVISGVGALLIPGLLLLIGALAAIPTRTERPRPAG